MARRDGLRVDDAWDGAGAIVALFFFALLIGLLVGFTAQRWATSPEVAASRYSASAVSKAASELGYHEERAYQADRQHEQVTVERLLNLPVGTQQLWENPETGNRGVILVSGERAGAASGEAGKTCRDLVRHTLLNNAFHNSLGTICRAPGEGFPGDVAWRVE